MLGMAPSNHFPLPQSPLVEFHPVGSKGELANSTKNYSSLEHHVANNKVHSIHNSSHHAVEDMDYPDPMHKAEKSKVKPKSGKKANSQLKLQ